MASVLDREQRETEDPPPMWARRDLKSRILTVRPAGALAPARPDRHVRGRLSGARRATTRRRELSVGEIRMSVSPGHRGALDVYVPLVDWGARFEAIRAPIRIRVDLQTVNRQVATSVAAGPAARRRAGPRRGAQRAGRLHQAPDRAHGAVRGAALGLLVAFAIRSRVPRLRWTVPIALVIALGIGVAMVVLIPPRGEIADPQYYAHGPDIPRALEAVEAARRTSGVLDQELDAQLVGLARLVIDPGRRQSLAGRPVITVASDLHNNPFGLDVLERAADGGPVFFVGDLTDRGSPLETQLVRRAAHSGKPFVFVSGNHDSDYLSRELAERGRDRAHAQRPAERRRHVRAGHQHARRPADRRLRRPVRAQELRRASATATTTSREPPQQGLFWDWLQPLLGKVDVVMVHEPALIQTALRGARGRTRRQSPLVFLVGHTHKADLDTQPGVTVINGGSMGAGGTGNLGERTTDRGRAIRLHGPADLPAARRRHRLDRPRDAAIPRRAARSWSRRATQ